MDSKDSHSTSSLMKDDRMGCFSFVSLIKRNKVFPIQDADSTATQVSDMDGQQSDELKALVGVLSSLLIGNM